MDRIEICVHNTQLVCRKYNAKLKLNGNIYVSAYNDFIDKPVILKKKKIKKEIIKTKQEIIREKQQIIKQKQIYNEILKYNTNDINIKISNNMSLLDMNDNEFKFFEK